MMNRKDYPGVANCNYEKDWLQKLVEKVIVLNNKLQLLGEEDRQSAIEMMQTIKVVSITGNKINAY